MRERATIVQPTAVIFAAMALFCALTSTLTPAFAQSSVTPADPDAADDTAVSADPPVETTPRLLPPIRGFATTSFDYFLGYGVRFVDGSGARNEHVVSLASDARFAKWRAGFAIEVPIQDGKIRMRRDAFNEVSDWFAMIRQIRYSQKNAEGFFFLLGDLRGDTGTLGHGSIVNHYHSSTDFNSPKSGLQLDMDFDAVRLESLVNSFTQWNLTSARVSTRLFRLFGERNPAYDELALAFTIAGDWNAPAAVRTDAGRVRLTNKRNIVTDPSTVLAIGIDLEWPLLQNESIAVTPYIDAVQLIRHGHGWHFGVKFAFETPLWDALPVGLRLEWREMSRDYIPEYFDSHYEIERFAYPHPAVSDQTKSAFMARETNYSRGWFGEVTWGIQRMFRLRASFVDYVNAPSHQLGKLTIFLATDEELPVPLHIFALYIKRGVASLADAFRLDDRALLVIDVAAEPIVGLRVGFSLRHFWMIDEATGRYTSITTFYPYVAISGAF